MMNKAKWNELPPAVRYEIDKIRGFIRSAKVMGDKRDADKHRAELRGYTRGLADAGLINEAEAEALCKEG